MTSSPAHCSAEGRAKTRCHQRPARRQMNWFRAQDTALRSGLGLERRRPAVLARAWPTRRARASRSTVATPVRISGSAGVSRTCLLKPTPSTAAAANSISGRAQERRRSPLATRPLSCGAESPRRSFQPTELAGLSCHTRIFSSGREASYGLTSPWRRPAGTIATGTPLDVASAVSTSAPRARCGKTWAVPATPGSRSPQWPV